LIVVDSNVLAYSLIEGDKTGLARQARERDPDWRVPSLWRHEFLNILASYGRVRGATAKQLTSLWSQAVNLFVTAERSVDFPYALRLAVEHKISAYDAEFIALAKVLQVPCITEDKALQRRFPRDTLSLESFVRR